MFRFLFIYSVFFGQTLRRTDRKTGDGRTSRPMEGQMYGQTVKQTYRQTDRQTEAINFELSKLTKLTHLLEFLPLEGDTRCPPVKQIS